MKRRLFNTLAGLSLFLCLAMAILWIRSYWVHDEVHLYASWKAIWQVHDVGVYVAVPGPARTPQGFWQGFAHSLGLNRPEKVPAAVPVKTLQGREIAIESSHGKIQITLCYTDAAAPQKITSLFWGNWKNYWTVHRRGTPPALGSSLRWWWGDRLALTARGPATGVSYVVLVDWIYLVPNTVAAAVFAVLPALWFYRRLRRPPLPGDCRKCGYDLRATPDRCPECGTVVGQRKRETISRLFSH